MTDGNVLAMRLYCTQTRASLHLRTRRGLSAFGTWLRISAQLSYVQQKGSSNLSNLLLSPAMLVVSSLAQMRCDRIFLHQMKRQQADIYVWCPSGPKRYELEHVRQLSQHAPVTPTSSEIFSQVIEAAHEDGSGHTYILKCCISPDAQLLVTTSSDKTAKIWSINRGWTLEKTLAQHQRWVWDACFSADSAYLVTASSDQSARLWDLQSGAAIRYYSGHSLAVTCCALNDSSA